MQARLRNPCRGSRRRQVSPPNRPAYNWPGKRAAGSGHIHRHSTPHRTIPAHAPPLSLLNRRPTHAHHRAQPRALRHGPPPPAGTPAHARHTPTCRTPLTSRHTRQPTHTCREEPRAPRHAQPTQWPAHAPRTHPRRPRPTPPAPECSPRELFPPADVNPHNLAHCRTRAQPSPKREGRSPAPPSPAAADQIGPPGRQVTTGPP